MQCRVRRLRQNSTNDEKLSEHLLRSIDKFIMKVIAASSDWFDSGPPFPCCRPPSRRLQLLAPPVSLLGPPQGGPGPTLRMAGLNGCFVYVDDVLVATETEDEHFALLERLFQRFLSYGEQSWRQARAREGEGCSRSPDPDNYKGATPLSGHAPLDALASSKSQRIQLSPAERRAFEAAKRALADATLLHHPNPTAPMALMVDASDQAIGAVLQQKTNGSWNPIAFFSKRLLSRKKRYSAFGKELLASYAAVRHFRSSIEGRHLTIYTDHKPLVHAFRNASQSLNDREIRHLEFITTLVTDVRHFRGTENIVADAMSRPKTPSLTR
uniref:RT_RNaseH_2 domain-containing protein n=1 Tax=Trichuris muris TaxID=70415 RepID=A0A5S6QNA3_TRIMR